MCTHAELPVLALTRIALLRMILAVATYVLQNGEDGLLCSIRALKRDVSKCLYTVDMPSLSICPVQL
jgi:hypothetical protein